MVVMTTSNNQSEDFITKLRADFPQFKFTPGQQDHWSPGRRTIFYNPHRSAEDTRCSLLHELAHGLLGHTDYGSDFELLKLEAEAWAKAAEIGLGYGVKISDDHIQNCLDTYRDWLHRRSTCPTCGMHVMQTSNRAYKCFNCQTEWSVTNDRFARPYRKSFDKNTYL